MTERRFNESEVAAIFERAAETQQSGQRQLPSGEGLTLSELQEIGREIGISPELVGQAAKAIQHGGQPTSRRFLGLPVGVGRTINLDRKLSEEEWERFVVDLRETFDARGTVKHDGSLRQWTNGNLQALLEPTPTGHRIRLRTVKGSARSLLVGGLGIVTIGISALIAAAARGELGDVAALGVLAAMGVGLSAFGAFRLPSWARLRERQMEDLASRVALVASSEPTPRLPSPRDK